MTCKNIINDKIELNENGGELNDVETDLFNSFKNSTKSELGGNKSDSDVNKIEENCNRRKNNEIQANVTNNITNNEIENIPTVNKTLNGSHDDVSEDSETISKLKLNQQAPPDTEKCIICGQYLNNSDILYFQGHPQNAVEEFIALTNEKLVLSSGESFTFVKSTIYLSF